MTNTLTIFLLLSCGFCFGENLVPNPSFEDTVACPTTMGQVSRAVGWNTVANTPDYLNACAPIPMSVPLNTFGYQNAFNGNAYMGLFSYINTPGNPADSFFREVIGANLITPLIIGQKYFVTMRACLSFNPNYYNWAACNKLGILFSTTNYLSDSYTQTNFCQIHIDNIISDSINWTTVRGSFTSDSTYTFLSIGNFFMNYLTDTIHLLTSSNDAYAAYYYIDDLCVSMDSLACELSTGLPQTKQNPDVSIFPNPFSTQLTFSLADNKQTTVAVFNFLGQQVLQQTFTNSTTINTYQFADGIYFYELRNDNGMVKNGKVLKK